MLIFETTKIEGISVDHFFKEMIIKLISILEIIPRTIQAQKEILLLLFSVKSIKKISKEIVQNFARIE